MSTVDDNHCDCTVFDEGDWVESKLNSNVFGIVVGEGDFGRYYNVQLAGSMEIKPFYAVTLRHMAVQQDEPPTPAKSEEKPSNVIAVDFTKPRALKKSTITAGEA
ncbi:hypothetical protein HJB67_12895 [Rhizobium lentis]|uniref:hypothetical protein n=1 Tax=Rhizobium lentis TaxID=1138194 RepID=UPI001C836054|nr:hypothetical protein [Rhizobium lentis]MBX5010852.1 hypothetical protein [Rhizobium lentis]